MHKNVTIIIKYVKDIVRYSIYKVVLYSIVKLRLIKVTLAKRIKSSYCITVHGPLTIDPDAILLLPTQKSGLSHTAFLGIYYERRDNPGKCDYLPVGIPSVMVNCNVNDSGLESHIITLMLDALLWDGPFNNWDSDICR